MKKVAEITLRIMWRLFPWLIAVVTMRRYMGIVFNKIRCDTGYDSYDKLINAIGFKGYVKTIYDVNNVYSVRAKTGMKWLRR